MNTSSYRPRRIQTAFRLDENLLKRLKRKAKAKDKSLNAYVEELLLKDAPAEPEWPKVEFPMEIDSRLEEMMLPHGITEEQLKSDERLAYILDK